MILGQHLSHRNMAHLKGWHRLAYLDGVAFWSIPYLLSVTLWGLAGMESGAEGLMSLQLRQTFTVKANRQPHPGELNHFPPCAGTREALLTQREHFHRLLGSMDPCQAFLLDLSILDHRLSHSHLLESLWAHQGRCTHSRGAKQQQRPVHLLTRFLTIPAASILQADYSCYITETLSDRSLDLSSLK